MARVKEGKAEVKGATCGPAELVHDARGGSHDDARINGQWVAKLKTLEDLGHVAAMVDLSGSMEQPLPGAPGQTVQNAAIGIGLMASQKSVGPLKNKVIGFATNPKIVKFPDEMPFAERVRFLKQQEVGYSTDFRAACKVLLDTAVEAGCGPEFFENFVLFVLSDMQINCNHNAQWSPNLAREVQTMFADAGRKSEHGVPFAAPHIVMWNLAATNTIATSEGLKNATSVSGYSDALLKAFQTEGIAGLTKMTPGLFLRKILESPRYAPLAAEWEAHI